MVSLLRVMMPSITPNPVMYTVLEDTSHGSNMICGALIDTLLEASKTMGALPRRVFIQADNTPKETNNTVVIWCAAWVLAHLGSHSRLQMFEFGFLVIGHTHDLIDAYFALISRALHPHDALSIPHMFQILQSKIANYPHWKHLRDIYDFVACQPRHLTSNNLKGTTVPNHIRIFCKRWIDLFATQTVDDHRNVEQPGDASLGGASGCNEACASGCCTAILEAFVCS